MALDGVGVRAFKQIRCFSLPGFVRNGRVVIVEKQPNQGLFALAFNQLSIGRPVVG